MTALSLQSILLSWREEKDSAFLYKKMALAEKDGTKEKLFNELANSAEAQAKLWSQKLSQSNMPTPKYIPNLRARIVSWMITHIGPRAIKPILAAMKVRGLSVYLGEVPGHPSVNVKAVSAVSGTAPEAVSNEFVLEPQHHIIQHGVAVRAAVFGINDGLVSNASLILGVAGASLNNDVIILSGIAGLCAGAFSMAAGEYISMRSQRELFEYQIALERAELAEYPEEEAAELSIIYQARGLEKSEADAFAKKMLAHPEHGLKTLAREELGLDPDELGSPWIAASSSFLTFALGAAIPLFPFFFFKVGQASLYTSIALTGLSLFAVGVALSLFTGQKALYSGVRMLFIGGIAGLTTYIIGKTVGTNIF